MIIVDGFGIGFGFSLVFSLMKFELLKYCNELTVVEICFRGEIVKLLNQSNVLLEERIMTLDQTPSLGVCLMGKIC